MPRRLAYVAVLNMGLGHATRSLPLITTLLTDGWEVQIGSNGRALQFLRHELPQLRYFETPSYNIRYADGIGMLPKLVGQAPRVLKAIRREHRFTAEVVDSQKPTLILSDHCYGAFHQQVPSALLAHQLVFHLPPLLKHLRRPGGYLHHRLLKNFDKILVPDLQAGKQGVLSGSLSEKLPTNTPVEFIGPLSSLPVVEGSADINTLISISGPEPQRTVLEEKILSQLETLSGRTTVVLGRAEEQRCLRDSDRLTVYTHLERRRLAAAIRGAGLIVCRPGYSTLMEIALLGKKALLIPTPGQTEQEYLATYHRGKGYYRVTRQNDLDLREEVRLAGDTRGLQLNWQMANSSKAFLISIEELLS